MYSISIALHIRLVSVLLIKKNYYYTSIFFYTLIILQIYSKNIFFDVFTVIECKCSSFSDSSLGAKYLCIYDERLHYRIPV